MSSPKETTKEIGEKKDQLANRQFIFESPEPIANEEEGSSNQQNKSSISHQLWEVEFLKSEENSNKLCNQQKPTGSRSIWSEPSDEDEEVQQGSHCENKEDKNGEDSDHIGLSSKSDQDEDSDNRIGLTSGEEEEENEPIEKDCQYEYAPTASPNLSRRSSVASISPWNWKPDPDEKSQFDLSVRNKTFDWTNFVAGVVVDHIRNRTTEKIVCCKVYPLCRDEQRASELFLETDQQLALGQWIKFDKKLVFIN